MTFEEALKLLKSEIVQTTIGNKNKTYKCDMCGIEENILYPRKIGKVEFMICENCKAIMDL